MLDHAKHLFNQCMEEVNRISAILKEMDSPDQKEAFVLNAVEHLKIYFSKYAGAIECIITYGYKQPASQPLIQNQTSPAESPPVYFIGDVIDLVELGYAMHLNNCLSYRTERMNLQDYFDFFEKIFHVRFSNHTKSFQDLRFRKSGSTVFLGQLRASIENHIKKLDE